MAVVACPIGSLLVTLAEPEQNLKVFVLQDLSGTSLYAVSTCSQLTTWQAESYLVNLLRLTVHQELQLSRAVARDKRHVGLLRGDLGNLVNRLPRLRDE
jgi:hypothetical protein